MSAPPRDRVWDYATEQYVRWSSSRRCWIGDKDGRSVREPQRTPSATPNVASSASRPSAAAPTITSSSSSRPAGATSRSTGASGGQGAASVGDTTTAMRSLSVASPPAQSTSSGPSGQVSGPRSIESSVSVPNPRGGQSTSYGPSGQGSGTWPIESSGNISNLRGGIPSTSQGSGAWNTTTYATNPSNQRLQPISQSSSSWPGGNTTTASDHRPNPPNTTPGMGVRTPGYVPTPVTQGSGTQSSAYPAGMSDPRTVSQSTAQTAGLRAPGNNATALQSNTQGSASRVVPSGRLPTQTPTQGYANRDVYSSATRPQQGPTLSTSAPGSSSRASGPYEATVTDHTGLQTRWEVTATHHFRDPANENSNRALNVKRIRQIEPRPARASLNPERDFKPCRVIEVLLAPPEDVDAPNVTDITPTQTTEQGEVRLRRFVIIREITGRNAFEALAIKTYYGRGVAAPGVIKSHHSIIFTRKLHRAQPDELPGRTPTNHLESGMLATPIKVVSLDRGKALDPMSRLDYADRYEFDWGVSNIRLFGTVHDDWQAALFLQYNSVWSTIRTAIAGTHYASIDTQSALTATALTVPAATSNTRANSSAVATTGSSSRQGRTVASSTSDTTVSEFNASRALVERFAAPNSGACTPEQMSAIIQYFQEYAQRNRLQPLAVNAQQVRDLARSAERRSNYIQQIRARWRAARAQASSEEEGSDEDDSDESGSDDD